jgi:hypothetical protein
MKFTFKSESYGVEVEMNFEADTLDEIEEMYKQFLKGSGFYFVEDDGELTETQEDWIAIAAEQAMTIALLREELQEKNNG